MSVEGQPNTILTVYSPFAWIEDTTGSFVNFPTTQDALISFPGTIACGEIVGYGGELINIPSNLSIGSEFTLSADEIEANAGSSINIVTLNDKGVNIGTFTTRTSNIEIGSNSSETVGETTGTVNIMCGTGRQEGSFNVLTNTINRGIINLGHTGSSYGGINIFCSFLVPPRIGYTASTYTNDDRYIGSSKSMTYANAGFTALAGNLYVFGNIATTLATGTYQVNLKVSLASTNVINPYLKVGLYTKGGAVSWVDGAILTGGTLIDACYWVGKAHAPALNDLFTIQVSGIATFTAKQQVCVGLGYNTGTGQLSGGSILSLVRIG